jgi:uncharacterized membrane protein YccC
VRLQLHPWRPALQAGLQFGIVSAVGYLLGLGVGELMHNSSPAIGALWCAIAAMSVLETTFVAARTSARGQIVGTGIGAAISSVYLFFLSYSGIGMAVCIGATVLACNLTRFASDGRSAAINVAVIMAISSQHPDLNPFANAALRFLEACMGTAGSMGVMYLWYRHRYLER